MERFLRPGWFFVDIGAHVGYYSIVALKKLGKTGLAVCFEPNPAIYEKLERNLERARVKGYQVIGENKAVSESQGSAILRIFNDGNSGSSSIVGDSLHGAEIGEDLVAETICLSDYIRDNSYPPPDMVKIDVEGSGDKVLRGMLDILVGKKKPALLIEPREQTWGEVLSILEPLGYAPFRCSRGGLLEPISRNLEVLPHCYLAVWMAC